MKNLRNLIVSSLAIVTVVVACAGMSLERQLYLSCATYQTTLVSLAGYRQAGRLTPEEVMTVDQVRPILNAACAENVPVTDDLLALVEEALFKMIVIKESK